MLFNLLLPECRISETAETNAKCFGQKKNARILIILVAYFVILITVYLISAVSLFKGRLLEISSAANIQRWR
jgi:hypothetical protein